MEMKLTKENKAEIRLIAQEVVKEYSLSLKEDIQNLTRDLKDILVTHNLSMDNKLDGITTHFSDQIKLLVAERKNDIQTERAERKLEIEKLKGKVNKQLSISHVYWVCGKIITGILTFVAIVVSILAIIFK